MPKGTERITTLDFEKETKNTYRYHLLEDDISPGVISVLYVRKSFFLTKPKRIKVTVEPVE